MFELMEEFLKLLPPCSSDLSRIKEKAMFNRLLILKEKRNQLDDTIDQMTSYLRTQNLQRRYRPYAKNAIKDALKNC